jgi:hypothetical protein
VVLGDGISTIAESVSGMVAELLPRALLVPGAVLAREVPVTLERG